MRHAGSTQLIDVRLPDIKEIFAIFARHEQALRLHSVWADSVNDLFTNLEMLRIDRRANSHEEILWIGAIIFLHGAHRFHGDASHRSAPASVAGADGLMRRIVEKHRHTVGVGDEKRTSRHVGDHAVGIAEGVAGTVKSAATVLFTSHEHLVGVDEVQAHHLPRTDAKICHKTVAVGAHRHDVVLCVQAQIQGLIRKITAAAVAR